MNEIRNPEVIDLNPIKAERIEIRNTIGIGYNGTTYRIIRLNKKIELANRIFFRFLRYCCSCSIALSISEDGRNPTLSITEELINLDNLYLQNIREL